MCRAKNEISHGSAPGLDGPIDNRGAFITSASHRFLNGHHPVGMELETLEPYVCEQISILLHGIFLSIVVDIQEYQIELHNAILSEMAR
jgi:hypothetical protein